MTRTSKKFIKCVESHRLEILNALLAIEKGKTMYDGQPVIPRIRYNLACLSTLAKEGTVQ